MPEVTDLMRVAQWAKSSGAPSDVYNAACRMLDGPAEGSFRWAFRQVLAERDALKVAVKLATTALEGAETICRYHGQNPPKAPAWHGGCESCQQPTHVREALTAIRALTAQEPDRV